MLQARDRVSCRIPTRAGDLSFEPPAFALHAKLVTAQAQSIAAAIEHGDGSIPRPINLHGLAAKLGVEDLPSAPTAVRTRERS